MTRCPGCQHSFPDHLINNLVISVGRGVESRPFCPQCALNYQNEQMGMKRQEFSKGTRAQAMLLEAREFLANAGKAPKKEPPKP